jgi:hypothetical protein
MNYQWGQVLPYFIKSKILRRKGLKEPQLYKFDSDEYHLSGSDRDEIDVVKTA